MCDVGAGASDKKNGAPFLDSMGCVDCLGVAGIVVVPRCEPSVARVGVTRQCNCGDCGANKWRSFQYAESPVRLALR